MKFTQRTLIAACVIASITIAGAKLSLKTMEKDRPKMFWYTSQLVAPKTNLAVFTDAQSKWLAERAVILNKELIQKLQSPEALNEFRDYDTVDGKELNDLMTNNFAIKYLKPALAEFVYPWDRNTQKLNLETVYTCLAFSPDSNYLAFTSEEGPGSSLIPTITILTLKDGVWKHFQTLVGHTSFILSLAFSPDGKSLASGSADKTIRIWTLNKKNLNERKWEHYQTIEGPSSNGHSDEVTSVAFSSDGNYLASGSRDSTVKIWTLNEGLWKNFQTLREPRSFVFSVAFSPNGNYLASGSFDHNVNIWTLHTGKWEHFQTLQGHTASVNPVVFSPNGTYLASGSFDKTIRIWTLQNKGGEPETERRLWQQVQTLTQPLWIEAIAFSPDSNYLVSASGDYTIREWMLQDGLWKFSCIINKIDGQVSSVAFSPDGNYLASGCLPGTLYIQQTPIDLVGNDNVAAKIMLLQLLKRDGKGVLENRLYLKEILATFDLPAQKYLQRKYELTDWTIIMGGDEFKTMIEKIKTKKTKK